jgi:branched-chain amino acid transport system substrate-binding protein
MRAEGRAARRRRLWPAHFILIAGLIAGLALALVPHAAPAAPDRLSRAAEAAAERSEAAILDAYSRGDDEAARRLSLALLAESPQYRGAPGLTRRLAESYMEEARWALALEQLGHLLERYPDSAERWPGIVLKARALAASGRRLDAAVGLDRALDTWSEQAWRPRAEALLADLLGQDLNAAELALFLERRAGSARLELARRALSRATAAPAAAPAAAAPGAAELAAEPAPVTGRVGLLAPLSGRYAVYGEAFLEGARLAVSRYNAERGTAFSLLEADTRGEPVHAALAARQLIQTGQVSALLGEVLSNPTVAAAVEANARGVPLLSPAATDEDIHAIGEWVFQNRISSDAQAVALARTAIAELLGARLAVLYPKQGGGEQLAHLFEETIDALGGEIVASVAYEVGATDFGDVLDELRIAQPELLFLPGEVEQLILLVPQLDYYGIDALLLGNDAWNSRRLARQGGAGLEGAVFPSDLLLKRDRALYRDFQRLYDTRFESGVSPVAARGFLGTTLLLEILGEGHTAPAAIRDALAERTAAGGDERARREALAGQVTLMTLRGGEIEPFLSGSRWRPAGDTPAAGFIDEP